MILSLLICKISNCIGNNCCTKSCLLYHRIFRICVVNFFRILCHNIGYSPYSILRCCINVLCCYSTVNNSLFKILIKLILILLCLLNIKLSLILNSFILYSSPVLLYFHSLHLHELPLLELQFCTSNPL